MKNKIFETLKILNLSSDNSRELFNKKTRDVEDLNVWKDKISGVIFIDDYYTGDNTYLEGDYHKMKEKNLQTGYPSFERFNDSERRFFDYFKFVSGKKILDFGCGNGDFLQLIKSDCKIVTGVEIEEKCLNELKTKNINCFENLSKVSNNYFDTLVSFHTIEHLPDPIETLSEMNKKLVKNGTIIIEVPHANDFLLNNLKNEEFKQFTLWSQHLLLHTRESLKRILKYVGFKNIIISGIQRYPLSNHINWLNNGKPGGHKTPISVIDTKELNKAYSNSLAKIDATDTLVAIANSD